MPPSLPDDPVDMPVLNHNTPDTGQFRRHYRLSGKQVESIARGANLALPKKGRTTKGDIVVRRRNVLL